MSSDYKLAWLKRVVELSKDHATDVHWVAEPFGTLTTNIRLLLAMLPSVRWRLLQANISPRNLAFLPRNASPNLEDLHLAQGESHCGRPVGLHTFYTIRLFQNSPSKLRHLRIRCSHHDYQPLCRSIKHASDGTPRLFPTFERCNSICPPKSESAQLTDKQKPQMSLTFLLDNGSAPCPTHHTRPKVLSKLTAPPLAVMDLTVTLDIAEPYRGSLIQRLALQITHAAFATTTASHLSKQAEIDLLLDHQ
ncbi:hypothetical protein FRB90_000997 [Tulasnella sp. 427]|nr:hypothetical protein FRB90_000997 [Tulasnella sp. 427]